MTTDITQYAGRTVDLNVLRGQRPAGDRLLSQTLGGPDAPAGELLTGVLKLAQRFQMLLLLEQGSMRYAPQMGCRFLTDARRGAWRTGLDVQQSFYFALVDVKRQLRAMSLPTDPDDEVLDEAEVVSVSLGPPDRAAVRYTLTTLAGTGRAFVAPLPTTTH